MDFIFANRWIVVSTFIIFYLLLAYIGIRLIFALPKMILRDRPFKQAVKKVGCSQKQDFLRYWGSSLLLEAVFCFLSTAGYLLIITLQIIVEEFLPDYSLIKVLFCNVCSSRRITVQYRDVNCWDLLHHC